MQIPQISQLTQLTHIPQLKQAGERLFEKKRIRKIQEEMAEVAGYFWERGWAERNAGNLSVNISSLIPHAELARLAGYPFQPLRKEYPSLVRKVFLFSAAGTRMRDLARHPAENLCIVYVSESGSAYHIVTAANDPGLKPTSEVATHLAIHQMLIQKGRPEKAVIHTHATELIALTHNPGLCSEDALNRIIWGMHPEARMYLPEGAGFIPYAMSGSEKLAQATVNGLESHPAVVWEKHGCIALGNTVPEAFDTVEILAKSSRIWFQCRQAGFEPSGLTEEQIREITPGA